MPKKRTSLDSLFESSNKVQPSEGEKETKPLSSSVRTNEFENHTKSLTGNLNEIANKSKSEIVKQTVYLPSSVHEQLRQLAFEERKKMHDYLVEGLDRVFKDRGLKPYAELTGKTK